MTYKKILLTGSTGELGKIILNSNYFNNLLTPAREEMDITDLQTVEKFFSKHDFDAIIHCAALARMKECEENPKKAAETNIIGTGNMAIATIKKEKEKKKKIRFVHISTDGVYPGTRGNYLERSEAIPYTNYGWTKLGAECAASILPNHCIIRTSFFDPKNIKFEDAATDAYSSKMPINHLAKAISVLLNSDFVGTINVGGKRKSDYEHYKEFKPQIKKCKIRDIQKAVPFKFYRDCSMNISLWEKIKKENE